MNLKFVYDKEKDLQCIMNVGPKTSNSPAPSKTYQEIIEVYGENPTEEEISEFIDKYIEDKRYDINGYVDKYREQFESVKTEYVKAAEKVFGTSLDEDISVFLTIARRYPYSLENNYFFVGFNDDFKLIAMHELWHFYTWKVFGLEEERRIGMKKYNDIKESLTVLLNQECEEIMGQEDFGYPQHQEYRKEIEKLWKEGKDIKYIWNHMVDVLDNES